MREFSKVPRLNFESSVFEFFETLSSTLDNNDATKYPQTGATIGLAEKTSSLVLKNTLSGHYKSLQLAYI